MILRRVDSTLMLWLVSRLVTRGIRIGEQQVFSEKTRSSPPFKSNKRIRLLTLWLNRTGTSINIFPLIHHTQSRSHGMGARKNNENRCRGGATRWRFIV